jgi:hypothetical protein
VNKAISIAWHRQASETGLQQKTTQAAVSVLADSSSPLVEKIPDFSKLSTVFQISNPTPAVEVAEPTPAVQEVAQNKTAASADLDDSNDSITNLINSQLSKVNDEDSQEREGRSTVDANDDIFDSFFDQPQASGADNAEAI